MTEMIWDSVPTKRQRKTEKFDTPVLTLVAIPEDKDGAGRKIVLNKAAQELLNIQGEDRVSFGFAKDSTLVCIRKAEGEAGFKLTKTCTLSDKKTYEAIIARFGLVSSVDNDFDLVNSTLGASIFAMDLRGETKVEANELEFETRDLGVISEEREMKGSFSETEDEEVVEETEEEEKSELVEEVKGEASVDEESEW